MSTPPEKSLKDTKTLQNIASAFAGESQARTRYTIFAAEARARGLEEIAQLFESMAVHETAHAEVWFELLNGGKLSTEDSLRSSARNENAEWNYMYPSFARTAEEEGFPSISLMFDRIAAIESNHERLFQEALVALIERTPIPHAQGIAPGRQDGAAAGQSRYRCMFCGNLEEEQTDKCPVCGAVGGYERI